MTGVAVVVGLVGSRVLFRELATKDWVTIFNIWVTSSSSVEVLLPLLLLLEVSMLLVLPLLLAVVNELFASCCCKGLAVVSLNNALVGSVEESDVK